MSIQIHDIEEFATYEQAFDFIQDHWIIDSCRHFIFFFISYFSNCTS